MRIGVIGCGTIASALVPRLARDGHDVVVSERSHAHSSALSLAHENVSVANNQGVVDRADLIVVAVMAEAAEGVLTNLEFRSDQSVISMMAGASLADLNLWVSPANAPAILLPFPNVATPGAPVIAMGDVMALRGMLEPDNLIYTVKNQAELDAALAAQAVLSPAVAMVEVASMWLGDRVADPAAGEAFLRALVGSNLMAGPCAPLLDALNTTGGYNQRLRQHMQGVGTLDHLTDGLNTLGGSIRG